MKKISVFLFTLLALSAVSLPAAPAKKKEPVKPLVPVMFKGKPFFPIGVYDLAPTKVKSHQRLGSIDPKLYEIGVNISFFGNLGLPDNKRYPGYSHIQKAFERAKKDPRFQDIALIINWSEGIHCQYDESLTGKSRRKFRPLTEAERKERSAFIAEAFRYFATQPNVIGYSMDEPENTFTNYFRTNRPNDDLNNRIGAALISYTYWLKELIDKNHPGAMQMPIIAWWGTYKDVSPIYDVLIANQYPKAPNRGQVSPEFSAPLYEVSFDAARAVTAARAANKTVIYMPPSFDKLGAWRIATLKEMRYMLFAPVTRGAMGIMTWRLNRCSQEYRDAVLYPAIKELSQFKEFYLGSWHDELVTSNHDAATVDYLKKFASRDELLADVKVGKKIVVRDFVPDVSYCLRKANGKYMLLVVNNRKEALKDVALTVNMDMPSSVKDELSGKTANVKGKVISDDLAPFDVKVYIWGGK